MKTLGIDAMNIRDGGGLTHLREILTNIDDANLLFDKVIVWGNDICLEVLPNRSWLVKIQPLKSNSGFIRRTFWQVFSLATAAKQMRCSVLFIAGGSSFTSFKPTVTICHNMLPFTDSALQLYPIGIRKLKFNILKFIQLYTFRRSDGIIFLSNWASKIILKKINKPHPVNMIIPHGINANFCFPERAQRRINKCSLKNPFILLYVSRIESYKNQIQVIDVFHQLLIQTGWPLKLQLVGQASDRQYDSFVKKKIAKLDPSGAYIEYLGPMNYDKLNIYYRQADLGIFASSCENMPIILMEKMASGLPIICNDAQPMKDFLKDSGVYVDFFDIFSAVSKLKELIIDDNLRVYLSTKSIINSQAYKWINSSKETFDFIYKMVDNRF